MPNIPHRHRLALRFAFGEPPAEGFLSGVERVAREGWHDRQGRILRFEPCVPASWPGYELNYRFGSATYRVRLDNSKGVGRGVQSVMMDGTLLTDGNVPLNEDGLTHDVRVVIG